MLTFTQIPPDYSSLGQPAIYALRSDTPQTIDIRIVNMWNGALIGTKRFVGVTEASFDITPYLRRSIQFVPQTGVSGGRTAPNRIRSIQLSAEPHGLPLERVITPVRTYLPATTLVVAPALLTTMPRNRLIAPGESEELTLLLSAGQPVTITAYRGELSESRVYPMTEGGVKLFRVATSDFPEAETLVVDAGVCGVVNYTLHTPPPGARRLTWRSSAGSMECYTFPVERTTVVGVEKSRLTKTAGVEVATTKIQSRTTLCSAFESREMLDILVEIATSPDVWLIEGDNYTPVDVVTDSVVTHRHGVLSGMELEIEPQNKIRMPWN